MEWELDMLFHGLVLGSELVNVESSVHTTLEKGALEKGVMVPR